ncbi:hypothetical protein CAPTEDRAFT_176680 [Capitella teleta]|uniref:Trichohyalin-plectin-homology domain-containing protein n=1 Tax=Capitella teleta TaxID=283909 RepID=R7UVJ4_CAPTE|nr:hypothetical protein CAPTEDRAFT_176680 [Capitella teleta]|eukprot:ELU10324.1 hypothetical protein CAPTEDRAFT_176680 [Capitella teleta]
MSAQIMHGRRKGQQKGELPPLRSNSANNALQINGTAATRGTIILSKNDWDRINFQLNKRQLEQDRLNKIKEEKERLRQISKEKVQNWGNTIAGQRQRKLEARQIREEKEEEEKKKIDIEEAKFLAEKRKAAIEKAKTQQYYQTDRVKGFHSALQFSEVLKEREAQLELRKLLELGGKDKDKEYVDRARKEYEEAIIKEQEMARERIRLAQETAAFQKAQVHQHMKVDHILKEDEIKEGEELKRLAAQYELEKKKLQVIRDEEAKQLLKDNRRQIADVEKMREYTKAHEEEEDEECRIFAAAKRKMMKLRAEKERELLIEKQARLEKIREKLHAQMEQIKDDEDIRIRKAVEEAEEKMAKEEAEKEARNKRVLNDIAAHRNAEMRAREIAAATAKKEERKMMLVKQKADAEFYQNEEAKKERHAEEMNNLKEFLHEQINEHRNMSKAERERMLEIDRLNQELLEKEEAQFNEYATKVIKHAEENGRNTYPLHKAALAGAGGGLGPQFLERGGIRPSYLVQDNTAAQLPSYNGATTQKVKKDIYGEATSSQRLGFVW